MVRESDASRNTKRQYYYDSYGSLIAFETPSSDRYYYHHNLRGDVICAKNTDGIGSDYRYDPWGCPLDSLTGDLQPFRYAGYYYDEETGLYYLKSRYYSPTLGRFLTRDGYGYVNYGKPQTLNLYAYAENNPVSNTDPSGHFVPLLAGGAAALAPGEAAAIAALGTAAVAATVELVDLIGERIYAQNKKQAKKVIEGLERTVKKHEEKLRGDPDSIYIPHWGSEIKAAQDRINKLKKRWNIN
jgi:RHS repeat-associated protein